MALGAAAVAFCEGHALSPAEQAFLSAHVQDLRLAVQHYGQDGRVDRELPQRGQRDGCADRVTGRDTDFALELVFVDAHNDRGFDAAGGGFAVQSVGGECHEGVGADLGGGAIVVWTLAPRLERGLHLRVEEGAQEPSGNRRELSADVGHTVGVFGEIQGPRLKLPALPALKLHGVEPCGLGLRHTILSRP